MKKLITSNVAIDISKNGFYTTYKVKKLFGICISKRIVILDNINVMIYTASLVKDLESLTEKVFGIKHIEIVSTSKLVSKSTNVRRNFKYNYLKNNHREAILYSMLLCKINSTITNKLSKLINE